jgi:hypothetical protein
MTSIIREPEEEKRLRAATYYPPAERGHLARRRELNKWSAVKGGNQWDRLSVRCTWWNVFLTKATAWLIFQVLRPWLPLLVDAEPVPVRIENHSFVVLCIYHFTQ